MSIKPITVGTSGSKASLDTNFGNINDNTIETYASITSISETLDTKADVSSLADSVSGLDLDFTGNIDLSGASSVIFGQLNFFGDNTTFYTSLSIPDLTNNRLILTGDYQMRVPNSDNVDSDGNVIFPDTITGVFTFDDYPDYYDSPHSTGIAVKDGKVAFWVSAVSEWQETTLSAIVAGTPTTYTLSLTILGESGADKVTFDGDDYTSSADISGLTGSAMTLVPSADTGKQFVCTGDITGTSPNYVVDMSAANKSVSCVFSTIGASFSYSDTFADSTLSAKGWTQVPIDSVVQLSEGSIRGNIINSINMLVRTTNPNFLNGTINVNVGRTSNSSQAQPGTVFRYVDSLNYSVAYCKPWSSEIAYFRMVAGVATDIATATFALPADAPKLLNVVFNGATVTVSYDGSTILTATDSNPLAGNLGPLVKEGAVLAARVYDWSGESL